MIASAPSTVQNIPRELLAATDNALAAAFNHPGAHAQALGTEVRVAHPFAIVFHVLGTLASLLATAGRAQRLQPAALQFVAASLDRGCDTGRARALESYLGPA